MREGKNIAVAKMGFLSVLKKMRQKEKEMRILLLYVLML